ncbi:stage III sporulation protein AF [Oikeobacillus pervagus]|uniref:Stage III sporulation protein AF n=1 Tax=Oikeobacillus pervagus TaxID=1325931 RepID=A0AAJ1T224_9BACI|nr:stage III sporulation protein AF [Oikeobacillus pervagus]MDQ0213831.1 stage III sporulation protein AF [Oikeobacillus pervagus]
MEFITTWITNIILFILLAIVVEMLLPSSNFQKYTKMVIGLLLILVIMTPILKLISGDFHQQLQSVISKDMEGNKVENLVEMKKKEIQASQHAYILEQMAVQLENVAEKELIQKYQNEIEKIEVEMKDTQGNWNDQLTMIHVYLKKSEGDSSIHSIHEVDINTTTPLPPKMNDREQGEVTSFLSKIWDVESTKIELHLEGGADQDGFKSKPAQKAY